MTVIKKWTSPPRVVFFYFGPEKFKNSQKHDFWPKMAKKAKIFKNFSKKNFFSKSIQNRSKRISKQKISKKLFSPTLTLAYPGT